VTSRPTSSSATICFWRPADAARAAREPASIVLCGTSILHWRREDGAPTFLGLPPATTQAQLEEYAVISREHDRVVDQPVAWRAIGRAALELQNTTSAEVSEVQSVRGRRPAYSE
jgi:hypothetical protein